MLNKGEQQNKENQTKMAEQGDPGSSLEEVCSEGFLQGGDNM